MRRRAAAAHRSSGRGSPGVSFPIMKLKLATLLTVLVFGCATVRVPVSELGEPAPPPRGVAIAEPQVELWLESGDSPAPAEREEALARSRDALERALERHGGPEESAGTVLYVRERAIARTSSRRSDQAAATAGMVVGAVVVVAAVIWAIVEGRSPGSRSKSSVRSAARPAPRPGTAPAARPAARPSVRSGVDVGVGVAVHIPIGPVPYPASPYPDAGPPIAAGPSPSGSDEDPAAPWEDDAVAADPAPALPPVPELGLDDRGYFAGDVVVLDLTLVDRRSGQPVWTRTVRDEIDPRDPAAMARAVDGALAGEPWAQPAASAPR
jgi:hypothetical protein